MNFLNLNYFYVCAEELNFTRAAKQLFISQQSLSNHIKKLEEEFGVQLFNRGAHITLTEAGECLYRNARDILTLYHRTESEIADIRDFRRGEITVGIAPTRGTAMLPLLLKRYHQLYPQIRIRIFEGGNSELIEALNRGRVDLAIGFEMASEDVESDLLFYEHQYIVVPKEIFDKYFDCAQQAELLLSRTKSLKPFAHCPFVMGESNTWTGQVVKAVCEQEGLCLNIVAQTLNTQTMLELSKAGIGVCICSGTFVQPELQNEMSANNSLHCFLLDGPEARGAISICTRRNHYQTHAAREFVKVTKELFDTHSKKTD